MFYNKLNVLEKPLAFKKKNVYIAYETNITIYINLKQIAHF